MTQLPSYAEVVAQSPMSRDVYAKHAAIRVRASDEDRIDHAYRVHEQLRTAQQRLMLQAPPQQWQTIGSGKKAIRRPVSSPEREAIMRRIHVLAGREQAVLRVFEEMGWRLSRLGE